MLTSVLMLTGCGFLIGFAMSTAEQRREARVALARRTRWLWPIPVLLWTLIIEPWRWFT